MRSRLNTVCNKLASLLWYLGEPMLYYLWIVQERWPRTFGWLWIQVHKPEWQKSSAQTGLFWLLATLAIFKLVSRLGHGWQVNITVSFTLDLVAYVINKTWIWRKRRTTVPVSGGRNLTVYGTTVGINILLSWQVIGHLGVGPGRALLGLYGFAMNPVMFQIRDRVVFAETNFREVTAARCRLEMSRASAHTRQMLMRVGAM
jgi:hypothetical protein